MSALTPKIAIEDRAHSTVCTTCGEADGTVRCLVFGWMDYLTNRLKPQGGSQVIALCAFCRQILKDVLAQEVA